MPRVCMRRDFRIRRLFPAPDDANLLAVTCNAGMVCYMHYNPADRDLRLALDQPHQPADNDTHSTSHVSDHLSHATRATAVQVRNKVNEHDDDEDENAARSEVCGRNKSHTLSSALPPYPRIRTPYPVATVAWCPVSTTYTTQRALLTVCRSQPIQLWRVEDGSMVSSYAAYNRSGTHVSPHTAIWLGSRRRMCCTTTSAMPAYIAGGYGGFEDQGAQVRIFDVTRYDDDGTRPPSSADAGSASREGGEYNNSNPVPRSSATIATSTAAATTNSSAEAALWSYRSPTSHGAVGVLTEAGVYRLLLCGYRASHGAIDVIDYRHRKPAAVMRGLHSEVGAIHTHPSHSHDTSGHQQEQQDSYYVYACGRQDESRVLCWDLRRASAPLCSFGRVTNTTQVCDFITVPAQCHALLLQQQHCSDECRSPCPRKHEDCCACGGYAKSSYHLISTSSAGGLVVHDITYGGGVSDGMSHPPVSGVACTHAATHTMSSGDVVHTVKDSTYSARCGKLSELHYGTAAAVPVVHHSVGQVVRADVGPTSALALLSDGALATVVGERTFSLHRMHACAGHWSFGSDSSSVTHSVDKTHGMVLPERDERSRRHKRDRAGSRDSNDEKEEDDKSREIGTGAPMKEFTSNAARHLSVRSDKDDMDEDDECSASELSVLYARTRSARARAAMSDDEGEAEDATLFAAPVETYTEATPNVVVLVT